MVQKYKVAPNRASGALVWTDPYIESFDKSNPACIHTSTTQCTFIHPSYIHHTPITHPSQTTTGSLLATLATR